jgi:L-iditol 2-dehydrogenase
MILAERTQVEQSGKRFQVKYRPERWGHVKEKHMKAALLVAARNYEVREVPDPTAPADGLVLKVKACGVCGSDLRRWREGPPPGTEAVTGGHEIAGEVIEIGERVARFKVGDRLAVAPDVHCGYCYYCERSLFNLCDNLRFLGITPGYHGGLAQKLVLTGEMLANGIVHPMPVGMTMVEGALAEPASSVLAAQDRAGTDLGTTILVMGGGPIGCMHVVSAKARGASVILSEPNLERRALAYQFEPDLVLDPGTEDIKARVREFTGGVGPDVIVCANPAAICQTQAVEMVRKGGQVILFGGLPKANPMTSLDGNLIHYGEIQVIGSFSYHPTYHALALEVIHQKRIRSDQFVTHCYRLEQINEAFEMAASGQALKVVVDTD